jgi:hypothetical protein
MTDKATDPAQSDAKRRLKSAADHSRAYRKRKKTGARCLRISIPNAEHVLDEFVRIGVLPADRRDDDAAIAAAIAQLCKRGHGALVDEREAAAASRPAVLSEANRQLLARLEET